MTFPTQGPGSGSGASSTKGARYQKTFTSVATVTGEGIVMDYGTADYDTLAGTFTASTGLYTAASDIWLALTLEVESSTITWSAGTYLKYKNYLNGSYDSFIIAGRIEVAGSQFMHRRGSMFVKLDSGDTFQVRSDIAHASMSIRLDLTLMEFAV